MKFNASNKAGTCLWCGRKLRYRYNTVFETVEDKYVKYKSCPMTIGFGKCGGQLKTLEKHEQECLSCGAILMLPNKKKVLERTREPGKPGIDGHFCTQSCSMMFGRRAALNGYRLEPKSTDYSENID